MLPLFITIVILLFGGLTNAAQLHRFHTGECPNLEPMADFDMEQFLGKWYVLKSANDNVYICLREEFNSTVMPVTNDIINELTTTDFDQEKTEKVYLVKRSYLLFGGRQFMDETGKVSFLSNSTKADMEIGFPYSETGMINMKHYEVISTDYKNYALIWRCQKTIFGHRRSAQLLSRYSSLDKINNEELKALLEHFEAQHELKFIPIRQTDCTANPTGLNIDKMYSTTSEPILAEFPLNTNNNNNNNNKNNSNNNKDEDKGKNKKKLINIDVGGFHLSISYPFW